MTETTVDTKEPQIELPSTELKIEVSDALEINETKKPQSDNVENKENQSNDLETLGINLEEDQAQIKESCNILKEKGVANVLNNPELSNPQKEKEIEKILVEAEKDPKEGSKKFKAIAGKILEGLGGWMAESTKETLEGGMLRFIRALFEGANYNSGSSLRNSEAENPDDAIPSADFFTLMREKPQEAIAKLLDSSSKLKGAGWEIRDKGLELLRKGKDNPNFAKEALMAVLIGSDQEGITSLSDHLASVDDNERWKDIGPILAQELFDKKMLSFSIKKELKELRSGNQDPNNKAYFGS